MPRRDATGDLLLGLLALRNQFLGREALLSAFDLWTADPSRPLGSILVERGDLTPSRVALLEALVVDHLEAHGGDRDASLAGVGDPGAVLELLSAMGDPALVTAIGASIGDSRRISADETRLHAPP